MTLDELTAIEERLNAATPGPWFSYHAEKGWTVQVLNGWLMQASDKCGPHDATFIAHAPTDLRTLIDALRAEREENERLRRPAEAWNTLHDFVTTHCDTDNLPAKDDADRDINAWLRMRAQRDEALSDLAKLRAERDEAVRKERERIVSHLRESRPASVAAWKWDVMIANL